MNCRTIKSILLAAFVCVGMTYTCQAQFSYGARIGTSLATFISANDLSAGGKPGFQAAGFVDYALTEQIGFAGYAGYSLLNPTLSIAPSFAGSNGLVSRMSTYQMNLAELGVTANYKLPISFLGDLCPSILAGTSAGYNFYTNQKRQTTLYYPAATYSASGNEGVTDSFNPILLAVQAGLRFDIPVANGPVKVFVLEIGYKFNYNNVLNDLGAFSSSQSVNDFKMNIVYTTIGIKFNKSLTK